MSEKEVADARYFLNLERIVAGARAPATSGHDRTGLRAVAPPEAPTDRVLNDAR